MKPTPKCPEYYNTDLYKFDKDKNYNQKYLCKKCRIQFTLQSSKKYKYYVSFKCNDRKCNHTFKQIIPTAIDNPSSENLSDKSIFSVHRYNLNKSRVSECAFSLFKRDKISATPKSIVKCEFLKHETKCNLSVYLFL